MLKKTDAERTSGSALRVHDHFLVRRSSFNRSCVRTQASSFSSPTICASASGSTQVNPVSLAFGEAAISSGFWPTLTGKPMSKKRLTSAFMTWRIKARRKGHDLRGRRAGMAAMNAQHGSLKKTVVVRK